MLERNVSIVTVNTPMELVPCPRSAPPPLETRLVYSARDPYAVSLAIINGPTWHFSRGLLAAGYENRDPQRTLGMGDVRVLASEDPRRLLISFSSPSGQATVQALRGDIGTFLDRTYEYVKPGDEETIFMSGVDSFIAESLGESSRYPRRP